MSTANNVCRLHCPLNKCKWLKKMSLVKEQLLIKASIPSTIISFRCAICETLNTDTV